MGTVPYNKELKTLSRSLRNSMTPHEQKLWYCFLRCQSPQFSFLPVPNGMQLVTIGNRSSFPVRSTLPSLQGGWHAR